MNTLARLFILCVVVVILYNYEYANFLINSFRFKNVMIDIEHPIIPNETSRPWDIVFLYSHDYSSIPEYNKYARSLLIEYCTRHRYRFVELNHAGNTEVSPYWLRVKDLIDMSNSHSEDTVLIYMDLDTCINPHYMDTRVEDIIHNIDSRQQEWQMYIGKDANHTKYINTGVLIIKNTEWSKRALDHWWSAYRPSVWSIQGGTWKCKEGDAVCSWAKDNYEQGEMEKMYRTNTLNAKSNIAILHMDVVSNYMSKKNKTFIYHWMGRSDNDRERFFKSLCEDYEKLKIGKCK